MAKTRKFAHALQSFSALAFLIVSMTAGASAADTGTLTIQGTITPSCGLTGPGGQVDLGDVSKAGQQQFSVSVNCNTPFAYSAVSAHQALVASNPAPVVAGTFDQSLPYTLTTDFQTDGADFGRNDIPSSGLTDANASPCLAASYDRTGCSAYFADSGTGVAIDKQATLTVRWSNPANPLVAGTFTDTITLTVRAM